MPNCNYEYVVPPHPPQKKNCHTPSLKDNNMGKHGKEKKVYLTLWSLHISNAYLGNTLVKNFGHAYLKNTLWKEQLFVKIVTCTEIVLQIKMKY